eukprot:277096-Prymnesium_polylepis.1
MAHAYGHRRSPPATASRVRTGAADRLRRLWGVVGQVDARSFSWDAIGRLVARGVGVRIWYFTGFTT